MPSPNFGDRRGRRIDALILHYTGMVSGAAALARLCDPATEVSCHYLVWEDGRVDQLVAEAARAWHAGRGSWKGETDLNGCSVGIEIVNGGHDFGCPPYPAAQVAAVLRLAEDICGRHAIAPDRVLAHSDIAPDRKIDPGEHFPWRRLAAAGVGVWPKPAPALPGRLRAEETDAVADLQAKLATLGYGCPSTGAYDRATRDCVAALQRHWRPERVDGVADAATRAVLDALLARTR